MGNNIVSAKVKIKGTRPLLMQHFGEDAIPLEKKERAGVAGNNPEEWRSTAMVTKDGQLYVEPTYIFSTLVNGGKYVPRRRGTIMSLIAATMQVTDDIVLLDRWFDGFPNGHAFDINTISAPAKDPSLLVYLDVRSVKNPSTKARNVRYRVGASTGWKTEFTILWDKTVVSRGEMESAIINAGQLVGLADARAIGFGRFVIESFEVNDNAKETTTQSDMA